jgi:fumarylpyruvate hydrolase
VHHEVELLVALGAGGSAIARESAAGCIFGYAVCLDMTRRDLQAEAKRLARPWEVGKAFERSAPVGLLHPRAEVGELDAGAIVLSVNGQRRQQGDLSQMIWKVPEIVSVLSAYFTLAPGDVILTGTPAGVGPVQRGDLLKAQVAGLDALSVRVV